MYYNQVKSIYKALNIDEVKVRESLARIFEQGGHLWATNGYIALDLCEIKDEFTNKCIELDEIKQWLKNHKKTDMLTADDFKENDKGTPLMNQLVADEFEPCIDPWFDIDLLKICADFLGVTGVKLLQAKNQKNLMQVIPCDPLEQPVFISSIESKAYIMRLAKR